MKLKVLSTLKKIKLNSIISILILLILTGITWKSYTENENNGIQITELLERLSEYQIIVNEQNEMLNECENRLIQTMDLLTEYKVENDKLMKMIDDITPLIKIDNHRQIYFTGGYPFHLQLGFGIEIPVNAKINFLLVGSTGLFFKTGENLFPFVGVGGGLSF